MGGCGPVTVMPNVPINAVQARRPPVSVFARNRRKFNFWAGEIHPPSLPGKVCGDSFQWRKAARYIDRPATAGIVSIVGVIDEHLLLVEQYRHSQEALARIAGVQKKARSGLRQE